MKFTLFTTLALCSALAEAQIGFVDVTTGSGIDHRGKTYGSSWGDLNGDGLLDIFVSNHANYFDNDIGGIFVEDDPKIYINLGNGVFTDALYQVNSTIGNDLHGALIFDFDNDGDNDILVTSGGTTHNLFFVNDGSAGFAQVDSSAEYNIGFTDGRGRMASVLDLDRNGIPDVLLSNQANADGSMPTSILLREPGGAFTVANDAAGFAVDLASHGTLMDLDNDGVADFVLMADGELKFYEIDNGLMNVAGVYTISGTTCDQVLGDFNGDLQTDIFLTKARKISTFIHQTYPNTVQADMVIGPIAQDTAYFFFDCDDTIRVSLQARKFSEADFKVHIGSDSTTHLTGNQNLVFHPDDPWCQGSQVVQSWQENTHVFVGRVGGHWKIQANNLTENSEIGIAVHSDSPITNLQTVYSVPGGSTLNELAMNLGDLQFQNMPLPVLDPLDNSQMGVTGDFDNDMDLDIYVLRSTGASNEANYLLENIDGQSWVRHDDGAGAPGDGPGIGDAVSVADFDNDGFLDLFVGNGRSAFFLDSAGYQLYRNQGNANHWLGINLVGGQSTRGGYGAVVYTVAGGVKQMRTQNGGEHHRTQNDQRIHFGLGQNTIVDSVIVKWPSGAVQVLLNLPVDAYIELQEPVFTVVPDQLAGAQPWPVIAPNPAHGSLGLVARGPWHGVVRVLDAVGRTVDSFRMELPEAGMRRAHPLLLAPGYYSVEFVSEGGAGIQRRVSGLVVE